MTEIEKDAEAHAVQTAKLFETGAEVDLADYFRLGKFTETSRWVFLLEIEKVKASRKLDMMVDAMKEAQAELESLLGTQVTLQRQAEKLLKTQSKH